MLVIVSLIYDRMSFQNLDNGFAKLTGNKYTNLFLIAVFNNDPLTFKFVHYAASLSLRTVNDTTPLASNSLAADRTCLWQPSLQPGPISVSVSEIRWVA